MLGFHINYVQVEELLSLMFSGLTQNQNDCPGESIYNKKYESILKNRILILKISTTFKEL